MPYITVESGKLTKDQKEKLIERLTEVSSEIMNIPSQFFLTTIKELPDENIGIGGKTIEKNKKAYFAENK
ncbi:MAG: tautomerase family protein [Treponema sp.]|nr:tautomerase family protein [Treponema sp.]